MAKISSWHFRHLLQVVWLKKACKRGGHGHPRTPLATPLQIADDHKLVSFNVKSLFTSTPLQLAFNCTKTAITTSLYQPPLPTDDLIMDLLDFCSVTSTYFQCDGKQHTLTNYLTKGLTILLHTKRLLYEPLPEEHKLFATHTTV